MPLRKTLRLDLARKSLLVLMVGALSGGIAHGAPAPCGPEAPRLDALSKRLGVDEGTAPVNQRVLADTDKQVDAILSRNPDSFQANFLKGKILLYEKKFADAIKVLGETAAKLKDQDKRCLAQKPDDYYMILNTLGAAYYNNPNAPGSLDQAESYFKKAEENLAQLSSPAQGKVLKNLGLTYYTKGDLNRSEDYYAKALKAGAADAAQQLETVRALKNQRRAATAQQRQR